MSAASAAAGLPELPVSARAPGKCIVFGEHGVVHGTPELLFAIDLDTHVMVRAADHFSLNANDRAREEHPYFRSALDLLWSGGAPLAVRTTSRIPRSAGLGSSAAFVAAMCAALAPGRSPDPPGRLADIAFRIERGAQGVGSPGDTSAAIAGGFLTITAERGEPLWTVSE